MRFKNLPLWAITFACFHIGSQSMIIPAASQTPNLSGKHDINLPDRGLGNPEALPSDRAPKPPWKKPSGGLNPLVMPPWGVFPDDFVVARQMPLRSGKREILMVSSSTSSEQRYLVNLPDAAKFEIYEVAFSNVLMDGSKLLSKNSQFTTRQAQDLVRNFRIRFNNNALSAIILADGSKAELHANQIVIKSSNGQLIESFQISKRGTVKNSVTLAKVDSDQQTFSKDKVTKMRKKSAIHSSFTAQSQNTCQNEVNSSVNQISTSMAEWAKQMSQGKTDVTQIVKQALDYSSNAMQSSTVPGEAGLPDSMCRPPVQCGEKRLNGASETRTDLFEIPQGGNDSKVTLQYEFYTIPDRIEMYYDGKKIFEVGPASGSGRQQFTLPKTGRQVGITLIGNKDPQTRWEYIISCTSEEPAKPIFVSVNSDESGFLNSITSLLPDRKNLYSPLLRTGLLDLRLHQRYDEVIHFTRAGSLLV
ncbi:hypothetical protein K9N68_16775 [Kovacikia minuta CCNUW1]|uniref:hypothetical protein n=1 Tax=Kovacikia minuta TaxID=2931930 RepID=UPI001CCFC2A1|nr:hypothetical protein [Kovacikia minuta]UBF29338.1 hypothetical protein K9N68_16775 [Kovacikia minuta CCNUW1]